MFEVECKARVSPIRHKRSVWNLEKEVLIPQGLKQLETPIQHSAFATCCMLHNMLLEYDGWLGPDLAPYSGGIKAKLFTKFGNL